jgi:hypothetical protein
MGTFTLPGADVRGYYSQLGISLPDRAGREASVRCFADPGAHRREDHDPSCSVNLENGAWHCWGCGARGGAYDAAIALGHTPRQAIDLMIAHGLTEPRNRLRTARELLEAGPPPSGAKPAATPRLPALPSELDLSRYRARLSRRPALIARLHSERGWSYRVIRELGLGLDRGRITIPIRDEHRRLQGLLRYSPRPGGLPKMLAVAGSRLGLIPHPTAEPAQHLLLVEGPPDMIAARSRGLPAIAVPGTDSFKPEWAKLLAGRDITIIMDADEQGRAAAERIAAELAPLAQAQILDLAPGRDDGYDLTDWVAEHPASQLPQPRATG